MILLDTSIWIDHFRTTDPRIMHLAANGAIALHPFVLGELLLGGLPGGPIMTALTELRQPPVATPAELAAFIGWAGLANTGIGYVDAHLLLSARLAGNASVLTHDRRLRAQAERLGVAAALA